MERKHQATKRDAWSTSLRELENTIEGPRKVEHGCPEPAELARGRHFLWSNDGTTRVVSITVANTGTCPFAIGIVDARQHLATAERGGYPVEPGASGGVTV